MELEYFRIHNWLAYHHGKAFKCENQSCNSESPKRYEWALLKGKEHKRNRNNYVQLCPSCHRKYDFTEATRRKQSASRKGVTPSNTRKVVLNNERIFSSITKASRQTGVSITSIHNNIKGLSKTTKAGIWEYKHQN